MARTFYKKHLDEDRSSRSPGEDKESCVRFVLVTKIDLSFGGAVFVSVGRNLQKMKHTRMKACSGSLLES